MRQCLMLIRAEHWVKNLFVFIPAFFAARLSDPAVFGQAVMGFAAFCLTASAVYILNDIVDAEHDRNHPEKRLRPIASGQVSPRRAVFLLFLLLALGLWLAAGLGAKVLIICLLYFFVNLFYTFWLKHIAIVDVSLIGLGFLLRVFAGGAATGVEVSQWLIVLTFLLALILGFAKRRGEYLLETEGQPFRRALEGYNLAFLDAGMIICSTVAVVAYLMYCFSPEVVQRIGTDRIFYTAFFVVIGNLRYLQLTLVYARTESPVRALLRDVFLQLILLGWIGVFGWLLYS
ncbi:MAG: decaprenyl-phosphate phosphoribosyltransferase [Saprospiraceae bacterium]